MVDLGPVAETGTRPTLSGTLSRVDDVLYPPPLERHDPDHGIPLPPIEDDADAELAAALHEFAEAREELESLRWTVADDGWPEVP